jgi:inosine/guanosine/xanthosine phosphorylase family protein
MHSSGRKLSDPSDGITGSSLAVILGSGLSEVVERYPTEAAISFDDVRGLTRPNVMGHVGEIRRSVVGKSPIVFVRGRKHYYEGSPGESEALIRFLQGVGIERLILTSAAGSLKTTLAPGELVLVEDIIDYQNRPPVRTAGAPGRPGTAGRRLGLDGPLGDCIARSAVSAGVSLAPVTLYCAPGPLYETQADVFWLQSAGASVASMSVAPEVTVANALGIQVACVVVVTNWVTGVSSETLSHERVLETGRAASGALGRLIEDLVERLD